MSGASTAAVLISAGVAAVGVSGIIGWASPLAIGGSVALIAATITCEAVAARLPVHAEARMNEGSKVKGALVWGGFAILTAWNVATGHMGVQAIYADAQRSARAPLDRDLASASAAVSAEREALATFDREADQAAASWDRSLDLVNGRFVTAGTRRLEAAEEARQARAKERKPYVERKARAEARLAAARSALERAPKGRPEQELWAFAAILEFLKGFAIWAASSGERRQSRKSGKGLPSLSVAEMSIAELQAAAKQAASLAAKCRHERNRREAMGMLVA